MDELDAYLFHRHDRPIVERPEPVDPGRALRIATRDGVELAGRLWDGRDARRDRVVVLASATGVRQRYYAPFAAWLARRGFAVVTFDYRGIGGSPDPGRLETSARMHDWGERDLAAAVERASDLARGPVAIVGHSVGGQLVGLLPEPSRVGAMVTVGAQSGDYRLWPLPSRLAMAVLWYGLVPGVTRAVGYLPGALGVGEDLPPGVALEWAAWCRTPGYLGADPGRREAFARLRAPVLAFGFDDDPYAPPAAVEALLALYRGASIERRQVPATEAKVGHFGFFREEHRGLWREAATFLERAR